MAEDALRALSAEETTVAFSGPAVLANRFFVALTSAGVRIGFAEQATAESTPLFRNAVLLPYQDAIELHKILKGLLKNVEEAMAAANPASENVQTPEA